MTPIMVWDGEMERRFHEWDAQHPVGTLYGEHPVTLFPMPAPLFRAVSKPLADVLPTPNAGGRPRKEIDLDLALIPGSLRAKAEKVGVSYSTVRRRLILKGK